MSVIINGDTGVTTPGVTDTGTLSVTGVTTLTGGLNAALPVLSGGTGVTSSTGTGAVVLGTSPSISGAVMSSMASSVITSGSVVSASGTTVSFTGIPSWAKRITLMFTALSTNGASLVQVQLGTGSTTYETSGYSSSGAHIVANGSGIANSSSGMLIESQSQAAGSTRQGLFTIGNLTGNVWAMSGCTGYTNVGDMCLGGGSISLGATLTALRLTTVGGDSFDAGTVNIMYD